MAFEAIVCKSKHGRHPILFHRLSSNQAQGFKFQRVSSVRNSNEHYYNCYKCAELKRTVEELQKRVVSTIRVSADYRHFVSNPELLTHFCIDHNGTFAYDKIVVDEVYRTVVSNVKKTGIKPSQAASDLVRGIEEKFPETAADAFLLLPSKEARKHCYQEARKSTKPEAIEPTNIPEASTISSLIINNQQSLVVRYYRDYEPALVFLADQTNLQSIHDATVLVMDGTFDYRPNHFDQTYTIHAVFAELPLRQSSFLGGIAFLPGRDTETYVELFTELRNALIDEFDDIGPAKTVLVDCELAVHKAIKQVFPEFTVRSCYFHFTKNVLDYAKSKGLTEFESKRRLASWINEVLGCVFLPELYMEQVFDYLIENPPVTSSSVQKLVDYLRSYWRSKLEKVCVWHENVPRTTNIAEGYNHGLQTAFQHESHPEFSTAFDVHVKDLRNNAYEYHRFDSGAEKLKLRKPVNRGIDQMLINAKKQLYDYLSELNEQSKSIEINMLLRYCRHVRYISSSAKNGFDKKHPDAELNFDDDDEDVPTLMPPIVPIRIGTQAAPPKTKVKVGKNRQK